MLSDVWNGSTHDRKAARKSVTLRAHLRTQLRMDSMKAYIPGAIWATILAGDASWVVAQGSVRTMTLLSVRVEVDAVSGPLGKVAAYTSLVSVLQDSLYAVQGTFKHMTASESGCIIVACLGLPPFNHSIIPCTQGAVQVVMAVKRAAADVGASIFAAVLSGRVWIGSAG